MRISPQHYLVAAVGTALAASAFTVVPAQATTTLAVKDVVLTVGSNPSQRQLTWLDAAGSTDQVQLVRTDVQRRHGHGRTAHYPTRVINPSVSASAGEQSAWDYHQASLTGLAAGATYTYRICSTDSACSDDYTFTTAEPGSFNFLVYGDPQVYTGTKTGQNGVVESPSVGWADTLAESTTRFPRTAFLLTAGDQVDSYTVSKQPAEWDAFLAPSQVTSYPVAPNLGNHDNASGAGYLYAQHFAVPNLNTSLGATAAGTGDYWYTYNGVLFVSLNSNSLDFTAHETFLKQAIAANRGAHWRVVTFHHAPFSSADHPNDSDVVAIRENLTPILSTLKINLVIGGHDHDYTRSYLMNGATVASTSAATVQREKKGQVLYLATNSASGGKFYDLTGPYAWAAVTDQSLKANYTNVSVTDRALIATTYEVGGTVVDRVVLTRG